MRIGILGSGEIGSTMARLLIAGGHEVAVANTRGPASIRGLIAGAHGATVADAIAFGDPVVFAAIPFAAHRTLPPDLLAGKIVVDTTNFFPGRHATDDAELESGAVTSSERLAAHLKESRVVKAVNTLNYAYLLNLARPGAPREERTVLFVAGDDPEANGVVAGLLDGLGFAAVETGSLAVGGRRQQPGTPIFNRPLRLGQLDPGVVTPEAVGSEERWVL